MGRNWDDLDPEDIEAGMEAERKRLEEYELSPTGIAEQNRSLLRRQRDFRLAADFVTAVWRDHREVEAVALIGSVALPLWKEVPRFSSYRRAGIALWHECKDLDLALWVSSTADLGRLRKAKNRALTQMFEETGVGVAAHQVDVFLLTAGTDRYLGRLCDFNRCPKHKPDCAVPGCGATPFLKQHEDFVFYTRVLAPERVIRLFDRQSGLLRRAAELPQPRRKEGDDGAMV